jgi:phenylacetate-CoA ligase
MQGNGSTGTGPAEYAAGFDPRVRDVLPEAARRCPGFARRLDEAGLVPDALTDVAALDRLPVLTKDELLDRQRDDPPFAGFVADDAPVRRIFQSPGPLYEAELDVEDPWRWAPALAAAGFGPDDVVLNAFGYHLSPAGAMFEEAARALGARVVPAGVGNLDLQVQACVDLGVTAYVGLPSYLKALLEKAADHAVDPGSWRLARAFVTAEPLPPSLRAWLTERVPVVRQGYGTAETGNLGYESDAEDGLHVPADALVQICDLSTGEAVYDGREGQVVVTVFEPDAPVVRFGTGDLSAWATDPTESREPTPRIRGWLGRVGDAIKVRGMFLHPRQISGVMDAIPGVDAYRFVVDRADHVDVLRCELVPETGSDPEALVGLVHERVRQGLRFDVDVAVADELPDGGPIADVRRWD